MHSVHSKPLLTGTTSKSFDEAESVEYKTSPYPQQVPHILTEEEAQATEDVFPDEDSDLFHFTDRSAVSTSGCDHDGVYET